MDTWAIIFNPTAGSFKPHKLEAVQRVLWGHGVRTRLLATDHAGHGIELARAVEGVQMVAAFGGDGTLNEVANGLLGRELPLLFLPGGTANVMAYELGLPTDPERAAVAGLRARPYPVHPGRVNERAFLLMAGFGFDGEAVCRVNSTLKRFTGKAAYAWSGLQAVAQRYPRMQATLHGSDTVQGHRNGSDTVQGHRNGSDTVQPTLDGSDTVQGHWAVAARATHYGGSYRVHPGAGLLKPTLGLVMVRQAWLLPFLVGHLGLNRHKERRGIALRELSHGRLECDAPVQVQVDGDPFGVGDTFNLGVHDRTVHLCFPWQ